MPNPKIPSRNDPQPRPPLVEGDSALSSHSLEVGLGLPAQRGPEMPYAPVGFDSQVTSKLQVINQDSANSFDTLILESSFPEDDKYKKALDAAGQKMKDPKLSPEEKSSARKEHGAANLEMVLASRSLAFIISVYSFSPNLDASITKEFLGSQLSSLPKLTGLNNIVIMDDLGSWVSDQGTTKPIEALSISSKGNLYVTTAIANDLERFTSVLKKALAVELRRISEEVDYSDPTKSMLASIKKIPGFKETPNSMVLEFLGKEYPIIQPDSSKINAKVYPGFDHDPENSSNKSLIIDDSNDPKLLEAYTELKNIIAPLSDQLSTFEKLKIASAFVDSKIKNTKEAEFSAELPTGSAVTLGEIVELGKGECRHKALLLCYLTEKLLDDKVISGDFKFRTNYSILYGEGHAYMTFADSEANQTWIFDPTHHRAMPINFQDTKANIEGGAWCYRSSEEINALRGTPLWCD